MNPKTVGEKTQGIVLAEFLKRNKVVLLPFGDNQRYDLVIEDEGRFLRVQCKTARLYNGCVVFKTSSSYAHRGRPSKGYQGDADLFAAYCPQLDKLYLVPVDEVGQSEVKLRVEPPKSAQLKRVRFAADYEM